MNQTTLPVIALVLFLLASEDAKSTEPTSLLREVDERWKIR